MRSDTLRKLTLTILAVLIIMMMAATVIEKLYSSGAAFHLVYHSAVFIALWGTYAILEMINVFKNKLYRKPVLFLTHVSITLILAGAFVTHIWGKQGLLHLRSDETVSQYVTREGQWLQMPFNVKLEQFDVDYYPGTDTPMDYHSLVSIDGKQYSISMNNILKKSGYRFYQSSYDEDLYGSILSVSYDPIGIALTYCGYFLLFACMLTFFFIKNTHFRETLKRSMHRINTIIVLLFAGGILTGANAMRPRSVPESVANSMEQLYVYYNGRITTLESMQRDYVNKVYGKTHIEGMSASQVFAGWLWYYDTWQDVPRKIKAKDIGTAKEAEQLYTMQSVASGQALKIFPIEDENGIISWYSPGDRLPQETNNDEWLFIRKVFTLITEDIINEDVDSAILVLDKLRQYQIKKASKVLPSDRHVKAEHIYYRLDFAKPVAMALVTIGLILFICFALATAKGENINRYIRHLITIVAYTVCIWLTLLLILRWYVSGHIPMTNGFEMMMLIAWLATFLTALIGNRIQIIQPLGILLTGFALLVTSMSESNPQITPLMPVLASPLLSIHVAAMMISYTLFGIVALNGIMGIILHKNTAAATSIADTNLIILYPALFMLTFGTFLGAIWANISWGSYWAWDPKETWALITILIYATGVRQAQYRPLNKPLVFNLFCLLAFLSVLTTYFGVNFILGGMHSYA